MTTVFSPGLDLAAQEQLLDHLEHFEQNGAILGKADRNTIKIFPFSGGKLNIKSFKVPNVINKVVYRFFRKSKAQRSYEYAHRLLEMGIGTPRPYAYSEERKGLIFTRSFYASKQLDTDLTYRTLVQDPTYPDGENILRAFTRFTFDLHEKNIEFLDHSPGNTLIALNEGNYTFYLVDLNRMNFRPLDFQARMKNFSRLTPKKEMVRIMANEYAKLYLKSEEEIFEAMWQATRDFQEKFQRKKALKKKLKFWKK